MSILSLLGGWKGYVASAALTALVLIPTTIYATSLPYRLIIANMKSATAEAVATDATAALKQFTDDAGKIHAAAQAYAGFQPAFNAQFAAISKDFHNAINAKPLPPGCFPDASRMRDLDAAVEAANSAAAGRELGPAVPRTQ